MAFLLILICISIALILINIFTRGLHPRDLLAFSLTLGLVLFQWVPFFFSHFLNIHRGAVFSLVSLAVALVGLIFLAKRPNLGSTLFSVGFRSLLGLTAILFPILWLLYLSNLLLKDGCIFSMGGGCEDMAVHAMLANAFLHTESMVRSPSYPNFHNWPLGYPFLPDFSAAVGMALGSSLHNAFFITAAFAACALIFSIYAFSRGFLSRSGALLTIILFFLAGNAGWILFLRDLVTHSMPHGPLWDYANNFNLSLHFHNMLTAVMIPMRTSLFGVPIAVASMRAVSLGLNGNPHMLWLAAVLVGSLPLINAHSFVAASLYCTARIFESCLKGASRKNVLWAFIILGILAIPQIQWIRLQTSISSAFIRPGNGYLFFSELSLLKYWALNGGFFMPLGFIAFVYADRKWKTETYVLMALLFLSMVVQFQPNPYDNIKILVFYQLGASALIAGLLVRASSIRMKALATLGFLLCTGSGIHSVIREPHTPCQMASQAEVKFADDVRTLIADGGRVLTAQKFNHPVPFLSGRPIVLGSHNWMSQHGVPFQTVAKDVQSIYAGTDSPDQLIEKYKISAVVVGPEERKEFPALNEVFLSKKAKRIFSSNEFKLYLMK